MSGKDTVYIDICKFEGSCWGCYNPWVNDYIYINGDSSTVGVVFLGAYLAHYFHISSLLTSICRYIFVLDDPENFSYCYRLFLDSFVTYTNALAYMP